MTTGDHPEARLLATPPRSGVAPTQSSDLGLYGIAPAGFAVFASPAQAFSLQTAAPAAAALPVSASPGGDAAPVNVAAAVFPPQSDIGAETPSFSRLSAPLDPSAGALYAVQPATEVVVQAAMAAAPIFDFAAIQLHADGLKQAMTDLSLAASASEAAPAITPIVAVQQQAADMIGAMNQLLEDELVGGRVPAMIAPALAATLASSLPGAQDVLALGDDLQGALAGVPEALGQDVAGLTAELRGFEQAVGDRAAGLAEAVSASVADLADVAGAIEGQVASLAANVSATFTALDDRIGETAAAVARTAGDLPDAAGAIADQIGSLAPTVSAAAAALDDRVDALSGQAATFGSATAAIVAETRAAAPDLLEGLRGADPAAGIETLTSLVSAADVFQLHDEVSPDLDLPGAFGALGTLDLLAPPDPHETLLGMSGLDHDDLPGLHHTDLGLG